MSRLSFLSTALLCSGLVAGVAAVTQDRNVQTAQIAPVAPPIPPAAAPPAVRRSEPVLYEMQALERRVRVDTILFMPAAVHAPVLAVTSWPK
jgi:hypothetical protein